MGLLSGRPPASAPTVYSVGVGAPRPSGAARRRPGSRSPPALAALPPFRRVLQLLAALCALFLASRLLLRGGGGSPVTLEAGAPLSASTCTSPAARCLLLASHGRLQWFDVDTGVARVLHQGRGVYYGVFPGDAPGTLWAVSRPHNWRAPPPGGGEALLLVNSSSGEVVREAPLASRFSHDALRLGASAYVADTGRGAVLQVALPGGEPGRALALFTEKEHGASPLGFGFSCLCRPEKRASEQRRDFRFSPARFSTPSISPLTHPTPFCARSQHAGRLARGSGRPPPAVVRAAQPGRLPAGGGGPGGGRGGAAPHQGAGKGKWKTM